MTGSNEPASIGPDQHVVEVAPVRPGEDLAWDRLVPYLRRHVEGLEGTFEVLQFPNGSANLTYRLGFAERHLVLRRPPFGQLAPGAHDMRREFTTLSSLWAHFDRAPRAYHFCGDHSVVGSDFFVMEYRPGEVVWGAVPASMAQHAEAGRRIGWAVVDALADLHLLDPEACGLGGLGRPDGYVARQVAGWRKRWALVATPDHDDLLTDIGARLEALQPPSLPGSILHNDYKVDNCQFRPGDPDRVISIFDWDMSTLGDPLMDLGTLLNYWPDPSDTDDARPVYPEGTDAMGLPTRAEVVERYGARTGRRIDDVDWYEAFACFKTAVVLQQLFIRYVRGESTDERMADRGRQVGPTARRAANILGQVSRPGGGR